jgi:hypothetical protein
MAALLRQTLRIILAPLIVFLCHILFIYGSDLYFIIPWFDNLMHFLGGASIGISAFLFIKAAQQEKLIGTLNPLIQILFSLGLVSLAAVIWEFAEYLGDYFVYYQGYFQPNLKDTMGDLFLGLVGGLITTVSSLLSWYKK